MKSSIKKTKTYILLAVIIAIAFGIMLFNKITAHYGENVEITVDGNVAAKFPLSKDMEYPINGIDGSNTLIIKNGVCYIKEADCPDKLCVKQGRISKVGQSIICLPHRVVITIKGESAGKIDSISK